MNRLIIFLLCLSGSLPLYSQTPLLERRITLSLNNEPIEVSLRKISEAGGFTFSYNPAILNVQRTLTCHFVNKSVRELLDEIFEGSIKYKVRGKYIILTSGDGSATKKEPAIVSGYVVDESTGERLKDVSIYDPVTLTSTVTDSYGYFEIKIDKPPRDIILSVNRQNYGDTLVTVHGENRLLSIPIRINRETISVLADRASRKIKRFWEAQLHSFQRINMLNIDDTLYRTSQVSLVPFVGSNHKLSGHVINDYSLNIFGGYSLGVKKVEVGGLFNLVKGNVEGAQFAGLFNSIGGTMEGAQFAGVFNSDIGSFRGAQFAGVFNLNLDDGKGVQFAGVGNITRGIQDGPQFGGVFNTSTKDQATAQLAGVYNLVGRNMKGFQGSGVFNVTGKNVKGTQLAGVFNIAGKKVEGAQIAGVFNFAPGVKGTQIGLINITDSIKGIPIGLMSFVGKGYHKLEVSSDEIFYTNLAFRTGVRQFYNIFTAGAKPASYKLDQTFWTFGYGIGTAPRLTRKLFLNIDVTANQIVYGNTIEATNLLNKLYLGFDYQAFKKMSLTFGTTLNGYITKNTVDTYQPLFSDFQPDVFHSGTLGAGHNMKMWIGAKIGVRFL